MWEFVALVVVALVILVVLVGGEGAEANEYDKLCESISHLPPDMQARLLETYLRHKAERDLH